jgi:hypothetical protein
LTSEQWTTVVIGITIPVAATVALAGFIDHRLEQAELRLERQAKAVQLVIDERDQMLRGELVRGLDRIEATLPSDR